jgi:hypothetical protein
MDELAAHQLSTVSSIFLLGVVSRGFVRLYPPSAGREAVAIGLLWLALTVAFDFIFFHYLGGHSWSELLANYNVFKWRIWIVLLVWIATAPYVFFRISRTA